MPQVTVYVRDDDLDKWKALEKKAEFMHNALNARNAGIPPEVIGTAEAKKYPNYNPPTDLPSKPTPYRAIKIEDIPVIRSPKDAEIAVGMGGFIDKSYSARKKK